MDRINNHIADGHRESNHLIPENCPDCNGTGYVYLDKNETQAETCRKCNGDGYIYE